MAITLKNNIIYLMLMKNQLVLASEKKSTCYIAHEIFRVNLLAKTFQVLLDQINKNKTKWNRTHQIEHI